MSQQWCHCFGCGEVVEGASAFQIEDNEAGEMQVTVTCPKCGERTHWMAVPIGGEFGAA